MGSVAGAIAIVGREIASAPSAPKRERRDVLWSKALVTTTRRPHKGRRDAGALTVRPRRQGEFPWLLATADSRQPFGPGLRLDPALKRSLRWRSAKSGIHPALPQPPAGAVRVPARWHARPPACCSRIAVGATMRALPPLRSQWQGGSGAQSRQE